MPWRRWRFVRDPDGRIIDVRRADDPWFQLDFLRDPEVQDFFREVDERHDAAERKRLGIPEPTAQQREEYQRCLNRERAALHARLLARRGRR